jgi:hypothetical protein
MMEDSMRKVLVCLGLLLGTASLLLAEPLLLEQADNVLTPKTLEFGLANITYQSDVADITNAAGTTVLKLTNTAYSVPLYGRYAFNGRLEGWTFIPYNSTSSKSEITGGASATSDTSGLSDPAIGAKYTLTDNFLQKGWKIGAAGIVNLPVGDKKFRQGLDIEPLIAARKEIEKMFVNINLGYTLNQEYEDENSIKQKPGDVLSAGVGIEYPLAIKSFNFEGIGEFIYQNLGESKIAGVAQTGSAGSRMDLIIGARYNSGSWKTKLGLDLSLGEEKYRAYDYRIIAGVTYLVKI